MAIFSDWSPGAQAAPQQPTQPAQPARGSMFSDWNNPTPTPQPTAKPTATPTPQPSNNPVGNAIHGIEAFFAPAARAIGSIISQIPANANQPQQQPTQQEQQSSPLTPDLAPAQQPASATPTITKQSLQQQENFQKNVVRPINSQIDLAQNQFDTALQDFRPFGAPAYAPAEKNQPGNIQQLSANDQQALNSNNFQRVNKDLGIGITHSLNGVSFGVLNLLSGGRISNPKQPTTKEGNAIGAGSEIAGNLAIVPLATLAKFMAVSSAFDYAFNKITGKQQLGDVLPKNTPEGARLAVDALEFLGKAYLTHKLNVTGTLQNASDILTKNIITKYELPKNFSLTPSEVRAVVTGADKGINAQRLADLGLTSAEYRDAAKNGISINIPSEKVVTLVDKPYWAKLKAMLGQEPSAPRVVRSAGGQATQGQFAGALPEKAGVENNPPLTTQPSETTNPVSPQPIQPQQGAGETSVTPGSEKNGITVPTDVKPSEQSYFSYVQNNAPVLVDQYIAKNGGVINTDTAKELLAPAGYNPSDVKSVVGAHRAAGQLTNLIYDKLLSSQKGKGNNTVYVTMGGTGSGKTSAVQTLNAQNGAQGVSEQYPITLDTTGATFSFLDANIQKALASGYKVAINFVYRDPLDAWENGVLQRVRHVPVNTHINTHIAARNNFLELVKKYGDNQNVDLRAVENSTNTPPHLISFDELAKKEYNKGELKNQIYGSTATHEAANDKTNVTPERYRALEQERRREAVTQDNGTGSKESTPNKVKPSFTSKEARSAQQEFTKKLQKSFEESTTQQEAIKKVNELVRDAVIENKDNPKALAGIRTALNKEMMIFAGKSGNYKSDYAMFHALKGDPQLGEYLKTLEDHINTIDKLFIASDEETKQYIDSLKKQAEALPQEENKLVEHVIYDMAAGLTGESRYALDYLSSAENFTEFSNAVKDLSQQFDNDWTQLHNDITSGIVTEKEYGNIHESISRALQERIESEKGITEQSSNQSANSVEGSNNAQAGENKSPITETGQSETSGTREPGQSNIQSNNTAANRTPGHGESVTPPASAIASSGAQPIGAFEKVPVDQSEAKNFKLHKEVQKLIDKYAQTIGEGHLPRNAAGVYFPETKNIRVTGMNDLGVAAHEITHFLDYKYHISDMIMEKVKELENGHPVYSAKSLPLRKEMTQLYTRYYGRSAKDPLKKRMVEGFATLLEKYIEMPSTIANEYPNLVKAFLQPEGEYYKPIMGEIQNDLRNIVSTYQGLDPLDKIGARVTSEKNEIQKENFLSLGQRIRTIAVDNIYPLEVLANKSGLSRTLDDASMWARFYPTHAAIFANNVTPDRTVAGKVIERKGYYAYRDGEFRKVRKENWATLIDQLNKEKQLDSFGYYLVARDQYYQWQELDRLQKEYNRYKPVLEFIKKFGVDVNDPAFKELLDQTEGIQGVKLKEFIANGKQAEADFKDQQQYLHNNGFTREEIEEAYTKNNQRFLDEEKLYDELVHESLQFVAHPDVALISQDTYNKLSAKQGYASMKRQVYDELVGNQPEAQGSVKVGKTRISSLMQRTGGTNTIINPLYNALTNEREILRKGMKQIVYNKMMKLALTDKFPTLFQRVPLKTARTNDGVTTYPQEKDDTIMMGRVNGKRIPILMDAEVKKTIDNILTHDKMHVVDQILLGTSRFFTRGTTALYTQFALTNFIRHEIDAAAQSHNGFIPLVDPVKMLTKALFDNGSPDAIRMAEYFNLGGMRQTLVGWQDKSPDEIMKQIANERSGIIKVIDALNSGIDVLAIPARYSEAFTRAAEYVKSINKGNPQVVAFEDAGRVTAPFHHLGSLGGHRGQMFVKSIPFFNPELQYLDQAIRAATDPVTRQRYFFIALLVTASIIAGGQAIIRFGTDKQKQTYLDLQPNDLGRYIWLPNPNGKDLIKLPMPPQMTPVANLINMAIAQQTLNARYSANDFLQGGATILPNPINVTDMGRFLTTYIPQILKPGLEVAMNMTDYPNWHAMVSPTLQRLPPAQQFTKTTSPVAKTLGGLLNISPIKIDALIVGYLGRAAGYVTGRPLNFAPLQGVTQQDYFDTGRQVQNFYNAKQTNDQNYAALKAKTLSVSTQERNTIIKNYHIDQGIGKLLTAYRKVDLTKQPQQADALQKKIMFYINKRMSQ